MDMQNLVDTVSTVSMNERKNYHANLGNLIDKLRVAKSDSKIHPKIVGIAAYRGYYSDIALCTESTGAVAYKKERNHEDNSLSYDDWQKENEVRIQLSINPQELADQLESLLGLYFDGYKGGYNQITRDKPLWIATDYGNCSNIAVIGIGDDLNLIVKKVD